MKTKTSNTIKNIKTKTANNQQHKNINVQKNLLKPKLISYYADFQPGDYYKNFAITLIDKCNQFGIDFDILSRTYSFDYYLKNEDI